jgi:hypothetical protein
VPVMRGGPVEAARLRAAWADWGGRIACSSMRTGGFPARWTY